MTEFADKIQVLAERSKVAQRQALTEEATKTAVLLPFIQALGFDVFNLDEVTPEFIADVGVKKGEKVDFVVKIDGKVAILIEAKPINSKLGDAQFSQLFRYFSVTEARLAILTNGREAWFFSDTEAPNKMDKKPFFTFDFQKHDKSHIEELARFQKKAFAIASIIEAASNLKFTRDAANYLKRQLEEPDEDFTRLVGKQIYDGTMTRGMVEQIRPAIQSALDEIVRDRIQDKLSITFQDTKPTEGSQKPADEATAQSELETTEEEWDGFRIVRAICARYADIDRISIRDAKSYCAVLMDDNNRKPICRLYFNSNTTKYIGLFDEAKNETKHRIDAPKQIYQHCDGITEIVKFYASDK